MLSEEGNYSVVMMARLLQVHRSGFYDWKKQQLAHDKPVRARQMLREGLKPRIMQIWEDSYSIFGVRRIRATLAKEGIQVSL